MRAAPLRAGFWDLGFWASYHTKVLLKALRGTGTLRKQSVTAPRA